MKWPRTFVPFDAALDDQTPGQTKIQRNDYASQGVLPVVDQGQKLIGGYCDDESRKYAGPLPVIVFGDHTRIFKFVDFPFALGADGVRVLTATPPFNAKFLFYYLLSAKISSRGYARHFKFLREVEFPLIASSEQRRIVELLEQADALRRQRAEADAVAERIRPALFHEMFGDPQKNEKCWSVVPLQVAGAEVRYGLGQPPKSSPDGLPLLRATNIHHGRIFEESLLRVRAEDVPKTRRAFLSGDDVLVVRSGAYTGDVAQVTEKWAGSVAGYDLIVSPGPSLVGEFIESFLLTPAIQKGYFANIKARAGQPHLNSEQVERTPTPIVPKDVQDRFACKVRQLRISQEQRNVSAKTLETLFQTMLYRAFTGELSARWREAHMKELLAEMEQQARLLRANAPGQTH